MLLISLLIPLGTAWGVENNAVGASYTPSDACGKGTVREQYNCEVDLLKTLNTEFGIYCDPKLTAYRGKKLCKLDENKIEAQQKKVNQAHAAYAQSVRASNAPVTNVGNSDMASSEGPKKICGNYGGEDCEATKEINTVALEGQKLIDNMGAGAVALKSADEQSKLAKKQLVKKWPNSQHGKAPAPLRWF